MPKYHGVCMAVTESHVEIAFDEKIGCAGEE